nr:MAG TPA: hypothetical protein [Caudoviricetes sp.]
MVPSIRRISTFSSNKDFKTSVSFHCINLASLLGSENLVSNPFKSILDLSLLVFLSIE